MDHSKGNEEPGLEPHQPGQTFEPGGTASNQTSTPSPTQVTSEAASTIDNQPSTDKPKASKKIFALSGVFLILIAFVGAAAFYFNFRSDESPKTLESISLEDKARAYTVELISKANALKDAEGPRDELAAEIVEVAKERKEVMLALLEEDPAKFLMLAEPTGFSEDLPAEAAANTERAVEAKGKMEVMHGEIFKEGKSSDGHTESEGEDAFDAVYEYYLVDEKENKSRVYFDKDAGLETYGKKVTVKGVKLGDSVAAQSDNLTVDPGQTAALDVAAPIEKKVAVILFNFASNVAQPWTPEQVKGSVFTSATSANAYFKEVSFGKLALTGINSPDGDVFGYYTITADTTTCAYSTWASAARTAAQAAGVTLTGYTNIIYMFPGVSQCGWAGLANLPGSSSWINGYGLNSKVIAHELGHNFGAHHSSTLNCTSSTGARVTISDTCTPNEYGDVYDTMGGAYRHVNNYQKGRLQYYPATTNTVTSISGQYKVVPIETTSTGIQSLRIPRTYDVNGAPTDYYYVEFRQPYGFDNFSTTANVISGASIRISRDYPSIYRSQLLDMTPETTTFSDSALLPGKEFYDESRNIRIVVNSVDSSGAVVTINGSGPVCVRSNPTVTINPVSQWGNPNTTLTYRATLTNKDSSSCAASTFNMTSSLPSGFTQTPATTSITVNPGASGSVDIQVAAGAVASGSYTFSETFVNATDQNSSTTATAAFNIYDQNTNPPTVQITSPADGAKLETKTVVNATASSSIGITSIEVYSNNKLVKTYTGTNTVSYTINGRKEKSNVVLTVVAYDQQGRKGTATITLVK